VSESEGDSICLKSHALAGMKDVLITDNIVINHRANAIKNGTATLGRAHLSFWTVQAADTAFRPPILHSCAGGRRAVGAGMSTATHARTEPANTITGIKSALDSSRMTSASGAFPKMLLWKPRTALTDN